jgi:DNA-binding response OmpR family regulator
MNILIVEDEIFLAKRIEKIFDEKILSNRIDIVHSFTEFQQKIYLLKSYDIIITDLKLCSHEDEPSGYKVIREARLASPKVPIIVVSGINDIERLREAFEYGANDYIFKPFRPKELELRILNWFKTYYLFNTPLSGKHYCYRDLQYDALRNEFLIENTVIPLTRTSKYILSLFFTAPEILWRETVLIEKIWGDVYASIDRNLRVSIYRLKRSLAPYGLDTWIQNIRGEGYIFIDSKSENYSSMYPKL